MFPEAIRAIRDLAPKVVVFENVKGLLRKSFAKYFDYVTLQVAYPELIQKPGEDWLGHQQRLERHRFDGRMSGLSYRVEYRLLNAADYGVPQSRERIIIVAFRSDLKDDWRFPQATHSKDSLLFDKYVSGDYWERHRVPRKMRPSLPGGFKNKIPERNYKPWVTVRDALIGLTDPESSTDGGELNHYLILGAKSYPGHTGCPLDEPAKTLKAGVHGVPGGENMIAFDGGKVRYFTIREAARIQTFPDQYGFYGSWSECMRQLGNAVPVVLANTIAQTIYERLSPTEAAVP